MKTEKIIAILLILGVISGIMQVIGLLRWTFVGPVLANDYVAATSESARETTKTILEN